MACTPTDNGNLILLKVDGIVALGEISSNPNFTKNMIVANSKGNPGSTCVIPGRKDTTFDIEVKVPSSSYDTFYGTCEDHFFDDTEAALEWGPFNNTIYASNAYVTSMTPGAPDDDFIRASLSFQANGDVTRTKL